MSGFSRICLLFEALELCPGNLLIFQKCPRFWPLSIVTLNFSVVVAYAEVRSYCRPRLDYLFTHTSSGPEHMLAQPGSGHPSELSAAQLRTCCSLFGSRVFLSRPCNGKNNMSIRG